MTDPTNITYNISEISNLGETSAYYGVSQDLSGSLTVSAKLGGSSQRLFQDGIVKPSGMEFWSQDSVDKTFSSLIPRHGENVASPTYLPPVLIYVPRGTLMPKDVDSDGDQNILFTTVRRDIQVRKKTQLFEDIPSILTPLTSNIGIPGSGSGPSTLEMNAEIMIPTLTGTEYDGSSTVTTVDNSISFVLLRNGPTSLADVGISSFTSTNVFIYASGDFILNLDSVPTSDQSMVVVICGGQFSLANSAVTPLCDLFVFSRSIDNIPLGYQPGGFYSYKSNSMIGPSGYVFTSGEHVASGSTLYLSSAYDLVFDDQIHPVTSTTDITVKRFVLSNTGSSYAWDVLCDIIKKQYRLHSVSLNDSNTMFECMITENGPIVHSALVIQPPGNEPNWLINTAPFVQERYLSVELHGKPMIETYRVCENPPVFYPIRNPGHYMTFSLPAPNSPQSDLHTPLVVSLSQTYWSPDNDSPNIEPLPGIPPIYIESAGNCWQNHEYDIERLNENGLDDYYFGGDKPLDPPSSNTDFNTKFRMFQPHSPTDSETVMLRCPYITHTCYRPLGMKLMPNQNLPHGVTMHNENSTLLIRSQDPMRSNVLDFTVRYFSCGSFAQPHVNVAKFFEYPQNTPVIVWAEQVGGIYTVEFLLDGQLRNISVGAPLTIGDVEYSLVDDASVITLSSSSFSTTITPPTVAEVDVRIRCSFGDMIGSRVETEQPHETFDWINYYKRVGNEIHVRHPKIIHRDLSSIDMTWYTDDERSALLNSGFSQPELSGHSTRYSIPSSSVHGGSVVVEGLVHVSRTSSTADTVVTNLLPGTRFVVLGTEDCDDENVVGENGTVKVCKFPFRVGNTEYVLAPLVSSSVFTIPSSAEILNVSGFSSEQIETLKRAGFWMVSESSMERKIALPTPVIANDLIIQGLVRVFINADEERIVLPYPQLRQGTTVIDSTRVQHGFSYLVQHGVVYNALGNTLVIEVSQRKVFTVTTPLVLSETNTQEEMKPPLTVTEEDKTLLESAGFSFSFGESNGSFTITRKRTTNKKVVCSSFIVCGLEHVWYVNDERVYVGLPEGTEIGSDYSVDDRGAVPVSACPFTYDNTHYVIGSSSKTSRLEGLSADTPSEVPGRISRETFINDYVPRGRVKVIIGEQEVLWYSGPNSPLPASGVYTVEGLFKSYGYLRLTVDFTPSG